jgi:hypothetical protein
MKDLHRRSAGALGLTVAFGAVLTTPGPAHAQAQTYGPSYGPDDGRETVPGVRRVDISRREINMGSYKAVALRDVFYQPGATSLAPSMRNDMICHCLEGELQIDQGMAMQFTARKGDVWVCTTGMPENVTNSGGTVAVMRITDLLAG